MNLPSSVRRSIIKRCAQGKPIVVVPKGGKPSRVFDLETYLNKIEKAREVKPWTYRKREKSPDPLGAVKGRVLLPLRREEIYE